MNDYRDRRWDLCDWDGFSPFTPPDYHPARTADDDIREGRYKSFATMEDLIAELKRPE